MIIKVLMPAMGEAQVPCVPLLKVDWQLQPLAPVAAQVLPGVAHQGGDLARNHVRLHDQLIHPVDKTYKFP